MYPLRLPGKRTVLREFSQDDVDDVAAIIGDDRVTKWLSFDSRTREQATDMLRGVDQRAQIEPRTEYYLAVTPPESDNVVGFVRLGLNGVKAGKLGYAVHADHWSKGYATDATRTILLFGFSTLNLHRISTAVGPDNAASIAVVEHLGFVREGQIRDHVFTNGAWRDSALFSLLTPEWEAQRQAE